ncbi:xanthine dehydrogenase accessory protein XdhC [Shimia ponticola]|uniref:xanthine dehydrogenase accessory protein XdhC n=1 Tax=Shimia ponticola TaxID=2582893 RepID=UPI0011BEC9D6|nr:xanthine dehydrogenase accessory protein XdhC [Shimia ponticola]
MTSWIRVSVAETRGSVPREAGATMKVFADHIEGTIGGGNLEWQAMAHARTMLKTGAKQDRQVLALGPDMGQCCGGVVTLEFVANADAAMPHHSPVFIWGAGHVGRAIATTLAPLDGLPVTLIDDAPERLPDPLPSGVQPLVARDMVAAVKHLPFAAHHLILTYSHDIDLALCDALLRQGFLTCGLIGSQTKWARFRSRLGKMGHADAEISRIACPIGDPALGKHPQAIAIGVAARLVSALG